MRRSGMNPHASHSYSECVLDTLSIVLTPSVNARWRTSLIVQNAAGTAVTVTIGFTQGVIR